MSTAYYVSTPDANNAICTPAQLRHWMDIGWPTTERIDITASETFDSEWSLPGLTVRISTDGRTVVMEGDIPICAKFAAWLRQRVSASVDLIFFDESGAWHRLTQDLSATDIARALGYDKLVP